MQRYLLPISLVAAMLFGIAFGTLSGHTASAMAPAPANILSR